MAVGLRALSADARLHYGIVLVALVAGMISALGPVVSEASMLMLKVDDLLLQLCSIWRARRSCCTLSPPTSSRYLYYTLNPEHCLLACHAMCSACLHDSCWHTCCKRHPPKQVTGEVLVQCAVRPHRRRPLPAPDLVRLSAGIDAKNPPLADAASRRKPASATTACQELEVCALP